MEKHKCKLCSRTFNNGRALGGHMKSHLVASQTTRKKKLGESQTESASSSSSSSDEKSPVYGLRENPRKSFRVADPEFSFANVESGSSSSAAAVIVQEDEEPENPVQRRVKRVRKQPGLEAQKQRSKKKKKGQNSTESTTESPEPVSSVSETSPEQDLAMCLIMLSRDVWKSKTEAKEAEQLKKPDEVLEEAETQSSKLRCGKCRKVFGSSSALVRHVKICSGSTVDETDETVFACPYCSKVFTSKQALGEHRRSHLVGALSSPTNAVHEPRQCLIDLNLPPPLDDEVSSVISEA